MARLILTLKLFFSISGMSIKNIEIFIAIGTSNTEGKFYLTNYTILFERSFDGKILSIDIETCPLFAMKIVS